MWSENMFCMISVHLYLLRLVSWFSLWSHLKMFHIHLRRIYILILSGRMFYRYLSGQFWLITLFESLFPYLLSSSSIIGNGVLNITTLFIELYISPFLYISVCFMYFGALLDAYIFIIVTSSLSIDTFIIIKYHFLSLIFFKSLSDIRISTLVFLWVLFAWYICFPSFYF